MGRHADHYGQTDAAMRWLHENDPQAKRSGYAESVGIIDNAKRRRIQRYEVSMGAIAWPEQS